MKNYSQLLLNSTLKKENLSEYFFRVRRYLVSVSFMTVNTIRISIINLIKTLIVSKVVIPFIDCFDTYRPIIGQTIRII